MDSNQSYGPLNSPQMLSSEKPPHHNYRMIVITVLVLLLAIGGFVILRNDTFKGQMQEALNLAEPNEAVNTNYDIEDLDTESGEIQLFTSDIQERTEPWVEVTVPGAQTVSVGEEVTVYITAFSGGKDITGYDLLIGVDPTLMEIQSISSEVPVFQIFQFDKGMYHAVTGIKDIQAQDPTPFDDTRLLKVVLKPIQTGEGVITLLASKGQERTQLVDKEVVVLTPQVGSAAVTIR